MSSELPILQRFKTIKDAIIQEHLIPHGTIAFIALHLSKTNIPASLNGTPAPTEVESIAKAISSMDVLVAACNSLNDSDPNRVESSSLISIWSNGLSNWTQFIFSEFVQKPTSCPPDIVLAAVDKMCSILSILCRSPETRQAVSDTTAIVAMLTKMWLKEVNPESFFAGFIPSQSFIDGLRYFPFASLLDRITGVYAEDEEEALKFARVAVGAVDGGFDVIAKAGIEGLQRSISPINLSLPTLETIRALSSLLWKLTTFAQVEPGTRVPHEFVTLSLKVLNVLLLRPAGRRVPIADVLNLLFFTIYQGVPIHAIAKALESGLMATLITLARYAYPNVETSAIISEMIEKDIAPCLVYRSVLKSVGNVKSVSVERGIDESVRNAWISFKHLSLDRTYLRRDFDDKPCALTSCDGSASTSATLFQCSGCQVIRYCSRDCQRQDWKTHREYCHSIVESNKGNMPPGQVMSTVDNDFIEAIMLEDIQRHWPEIHSALEIDPETGLATKAIVVKLNYRSAPRVKVEAVPAESMNFRDVPRAVDTIGSCQAFVAVAYVRHPQQEGVFSLSKAYLVEAMEEIYTWEREWEQEREDMYW